MLEPKIIEASGVTFAMVDLSQADHAGYYNWLFQCCFMAAVPLPSIWMKIIFWIWMVIRSTFCSTNAYV